MAAAFPENERLEDLLRSTAGPLRNRASQATFLCYHSIAQDGPPFLSIEPEMFERHLAMMRRRGYLSGGLNALKLLASGSRLHGRHAFLTFDDGYVDNFTVALPLLRAYGFSAVMFVLPVYVDTGAELNWAEVEPKRRHYPGIMRSLDWSMAEALIEAGCEIGSHTLSHPHLPAIGDEALRQELLDSRRRIAERLGRCDTLAYPFGEWNPHVARAAAAAGYSFAFSLPFEEQSTASRMAIPRVTIDHRDDERRFSLKLSPVGRRLLFSPVRGAIRRMIRRTPRSSWRRARCSDRRCR